MLKASSRLLAQLSLASDLVLIGACWVEAYFLRGYEYSRLVILYFWVLSIVTVSLSRAVFREALRFARRRGHILRHGLIVGSGEVAAEVVRMLRRRPDVGIQLRGLVGDRPEVPG